jgi:hypothetical protein
MVWIQLAQNRVQWLDHVNMATNTDIPQDKFFDQMSNHHLLKNFLHGVSYFYVDKANHSWVTLFFI